MAGRLELAGRRRRLARLPLHAHRSARGRARRRRGASPSVRCCATSRRRRSTSCSPWSRGYFLSAVRPARPAHVAVPARAPALAGRGLLGVAGRAARLVTAPRAVGVRAAYPLVPPPVRAWVEATLGSPVVDGRSRSAACRPAARRDSSAPTAPAPSSRPSGRSSTRTPPVLFRREVLRSTCLGEHPLWAGLIASYDDGGWVALLLDDVEGAHPDLVDDAEMERSCVRSTDLSARAAGAATCRPTALRACVDPVPRTSRQWADGLDDLRAMRHEVPPDLLAPWVLPRIDRLRRGSCASSPTRPWTRWCTVDIRNDNLVRDPRETWCSWTGACLHAGPDLARPARRPARAGRQPVVRRVTAPVGGAARRRRRGGHLLARRDGGAPGVARSDTAVDVNLPTLAAFPAYRVASVPGGRGPYARALMAVTGPTARPPGRRFGRSRGRAVVFLLHVRAAPHLGTRSRGI